MDKIIIKGAREHNLKNIELEIPKNKLVVLTGISGSGKSSLAFDTVYAEGQRRYVESLSSYARQFLGTMKKPDVDLIEGLSPAISIDQKTTSHNPRSTVGTVTEVYDYLRLLFARIGHPHCPICGTEISRQTKDQILQSILKLPEKYPEYKKQGLRVTIFAPLVKDRKGEYFDLFASLKKRGFRKVRIDKRTFELDDDIVLIKTNKHTIDLVIDSLIISDKTDISRLLNDIEQALSFGNGELVLGVIKDVSFDIPDKPTSYEDKLYSEKFACPKDSTSISEMEPRMFSFNTPHGACATCSGMGIVLTVDKDLVFNPNLTISEGGILPYFNLTSSDTWFSRTFKVFCKENKIPLDVKIEDLPEHKKELILTGTKNKEYIVEGENRFGSETSIIESYKGLTSELKQKYEQSDSSYIRSQIERFMRNKVCPDCSGKRLKKEALMVTICDRSIMEICDMPIAESLRFILDSEKKLNSREIEIGRVIYKEIKERLQFLLDVGLEYLSLSRTASTLAGGEAQRIRLASQIGSGLTGVLYVLDEPSIGLHQRDNTRLINTLKKLRDLGNTVLVVEHDQEMMECADYIVDFGPGAGIYGGEVVAKGTYNQILYSETSVTGKYLSKKIKIQENTKNIDIKTMFDKTLTIKGAKEHNLKNITVKIPLNKFVVISGVSGSGKSTLINDILYHGLMTQNNPYHKQKPGEFDGFEGEGQIKNVFMIDQSPIGRTPRSNPATYTGAFTYIRDIFSKTKQAKIAGYGPGRFSFNVKGGRCETCEGEGQIKIEMQFLPDIYVICDTCNGKQYNLEALSINYKEKNISDVLNMSVDEAVKFFDTVPALHNRLQTLNDVGLNYIRLGQSATTLSGGEAQRVKLASELSKRGRDALYILDEPTTGLHFADLEKLLTVLKKLVEQGNSVVVIEHNLDVIKNADYVIDLGPEGGDKGGNIVHEGTIKGLMDNSASYTGKYLKKIV